MIGYRINYTAPHVFMIGVTLGESRLEYIDGNDEDFIGMSLYLGMGCIRFGYIKERKEEYEEK